MTALYHTIIDGPSDSYVSSILYERANCSRFSLNYFYLSLVFTHPLYMPQFLCSLLAIFLILLRCVLKLFVNSLSTHSHMRHLYCTMMRKCWLKHT